MLGKNKLFQPEITLLDIWLFLPYLSHFLSDFDGVKSKVELFTIIFNMISYLAIYWLVPMKYSPPPPLGLSFTHTL